mgnify:CR=1 FL=1
MRIIGIILKVLVGLYTAFCTIWATIGIVAYKTGHANVYHKDGWTNVRFTEPLEFLNGRSN